MTATPPGQAADLDAAILASQKAVSLTPAGDPDLAVRWSNLAVLLGMRFGRAGDAADLDASIDASREAVGLTSPDDRDLAGHLSNLAAALSIRFERTGAVADLNATIEAAQQAVLRTPPGDPYLAAMLSNLGSALGVRFAQAGDAADLDTAIDALRRAAVLMPPGHENFAGGQSNLGVALETRFGLAGDAADLNAAIQAAQRAVDHTPLGHPNLALYLSGLGGSLKARFGLAHDAADLNAAIAILRKAADLTLPGQPDLTARLSNLGIVLLARFALTEDAADLDAAIDVTRRAVSLTPPGHPGLARHLSNQGIALHTRFAVAEDAADLDAAIDAARQAIGLTPPGHPDLALYLIRLGAVVHARFRLAGEAADLDAAIAHWREASAEAAAPPKVRLDAASRWVFAAADANRTRQAADGSAVAVGLLHLVAWHGLDRTAKEYQLARRAGLPAASATCAILDDRPELAVELLEQGRSVQWTQALNLRSDLTLLTEERPDLAGRLDAIRIILDRPESVPVELRRRKAREWDEVINQVRALDGFEHFLAAVPYATLKAKLEATGSDGPVVIVNASPYGCHALIVDTGSLRPRVVRLSDLTVDEAVRQADELLKALAGCVDPTQTSEQRDKHRRTIFGVLDWLWDVIAEPVLTALGYSGVPQTGSPWPRVWWCPTGPLSALPIHAAGHHPGQPAAASGSADSVLDRVISSYTPTLTALTRAREPGEDSPARQLAVGMPVTPGLPSLRAVREELKVLAPYFPLDVGNVQLTGPQATRADVLTAIATHSWLHLSCHASQQQADPASSGFAFWDGTLTITDLAAQPARHQELAFLSACQTATGAIRYLDEAIHLAAAMQLLGYRHVVATLWAIADLPAPQVARTFYAIVREHGPPGPPRTAEALHEAIRELRQTHASHPQIWAPYVHFGG